MLSNCTESWTQTDRARLTAAAGCLVGLPRGLQHSDRDGNHRASDPRGRSHPDECEEEGDAGQRIRAACLVREARPTI